MPRQLPYGPNQHESWNDKTISYLHGGDAAQTATQQKEGETV